MYLTIPWSNIFYNIILLKRLFDIYNFQDRHQRRGGQYLQAYNS